MSRYVMYVPRFYASVSDFLGEIFFSIGLVHSITQYGADATAATANINTETVILLRFAFTILTALSLVTVQKLFEST